MKIAFLGNMNNVVFHLAESLHKCKYDVTLFIDAPKNFLLDRPESINPSLRNKYPSWIKEMIVEDKLKALRIIFPLIFFKKLIHCLNREYDIIFLNGLWISLGKHIHKEKLVINIFGGHEVDLADRDYLNDAVRLFFQTRPHAFRPQFVIKYFYKKLASTLRSGIRRANVINYYSTGINEKGDKILKEIKANQEYSRLELRGFDCSAFPYVKPDLARKKFVILNVTRFFFQNRRNDNKRNDLMIQGIGKFIRDNQIKKDIEIIFFEKGEDVEAAKKMCDEEGLAPFTQWHQQVSLDALTQYFFYCDVAFDQLGCHWIGAGLFSMLTGRPLIANARPEIFEQLTGEKSPVCQATSAEEVCTWLTKLYSDRHLVNQIGLQSQAYVLNHYDLQKTVDFYINTFNDFRKKQ